MKMIRLRLLLFAILWGLVSIYCNANVGYNIRNYGAKGDGVTLDHVAINKAIDEAAQKGGGTVFFPAGNYLSGSIRMKDNINLHLDRGARLIAASQTGLMDYYDKPEAFEGKRYQDQGHSFFQNSLIWGRNLKNVSISGLGVIDGVGLSHNWNLDGFPKILGVANKAIAFVECNNVRITDVTILNGGWFAIIVTGCNLVTLDKLLIDSNRDGIDIDCCTNVVVSNCQVNTPSDDAIVLKSSYALKRKIVTENVLINNCQVSAYQLGTLYSGEMIVPEKSKKVFRTGRIKMGTESNGGFRNIAISNCVFRYCKGLALQEVDGGLMENITINNLAMFDVQTYPIYITLGERLRDPDTTSVSVGRNISISNVVAYVNDSVSGIQITGTPKFRLENIKLSNISIIFNGGGLKKHTEKPYYELGKDYPEVRPYVVVPSYGVYARHINNLQLENVSVSTIKGDERPAMIALDIDGLRIRNFEAKLNQGVFPARFERVKQMSVLESPILNGSLKDGVITKF